MIQTIKNAWKIEELRKKILFTVFALLIFRLGSAVPVPFVDTQALGTYLDSMSGTIFGLMNAMSGGSFSTATVFALSIQPYINSSIIIQLLTVAIPALERLQKDGGEEGRKKIAAITRYTTVGIALLQGFGYYTLIKANGLLDLGDMNGVWAGVVIVASFVAGSAFIMWLGEQITEFGIGNGISIILFAGIVSRGPSMVMSMYTGVTRWLNPLTTEQMSSLNWTAEQIAAYQKSLLHPAFIPVIIIGMLALIVFIVFIQNAERRIPVQYAKRVVGRKMYGGQASHIPLKVNMSGVMPIIFASALVSIPNMIGSFINFDAAAHPFWASFFQVFNYRSFLYAVIYLLLIVAFNYFYVAIQYNPVEIANNLRKNNGAIPGIRPGKPTSDFITKSLSKITFIGAMFLGVVAILPIILGNVTGTNIQLGGTSLLIVVGVALDTGRSMESYMLMRHHKGFLE